MLTIHSKGFVSICGYVKMPMNRLLPFIHLSLCFPLLPVSNLLFARYIRKPFNGLDVLIADNAQMCALRLAIDPEICLSLRFYTKEILFEISNAIKRYVYNLYCRRRYDFTYFTISSIK